MDQYQYGISSGFLPSKLVNLEAWYRFNTGITVTGAGVSNWADQSGNGRDLLQSTDTNRPSLESDGTILFDGVDNFLKAAAFTLVQPETIYILFKQITFMAEDTVFDGEVINRGRLRQLSSSPQLTIIADGAGALPLDNSDLAIGVYGVISIVINGSSSVIQVNKNTPVTGTLGSLDMGGFILGARGDASIQFSNIQTKEVIIYSEAHDADQRTKVINYLNTVNDK